MRAAKVLLLVLALPLCGCPQARTGSMIYYTFSGDTPMSEEGFHYEQFAVINGAIVSLGTFRNALCALSPFDVTTSDAGTFPNRRKCVVSADYREDDEGRATSGKFYGVLDGSDPVTSLPVGGIEMPTPVDCTGATEVFITIEPDNRGTPLPSHDVILQGYVAGTVQGVLTGELTNPQGYAKIRGHVSLVPLRDDVL